jgi:hypothetical protein
MALAVREGTYKRRKRRYDMRTLVMTFGPELLHDMATTPFLSLHNIAVALAA